MAYANNECGFNKFFIIASTMPRPLKCRKVALNPEHCCFKPSGGDPAESGFVTMTYDEFEAIRLADVEGLYQEKAALHMHVSRQTFGNILGSARRKLGEMLVYGRTLNVTGGSVMVSSEERKFGCAGCGHQWVVAHGIQRPSECPACAGNSIHRQSPGGGFGGGRRGGGRCHGYKTALDGQQRGFGDGNCAGGRRSFGGNPDLQRPQGGVL
jgi:predicted DNA-binding protein (UPF0251 family)